jgi:ABC-type lipoprotein release transport system permease subunit
MQFLLFLHLIVISGILVGLIEGSTDANRYRYTGDVTVSVLPKKTYIERSAPIIELIKSQDYVESVSARYAEGVRIEANYKNRTRLSDQVDNAAGLVAGINPLEEDKTTNLSKYLVEGEYLDENDTDKILIGANLLYKYTPIESPGFSTLKNVELGSKVRLVIAGKTKEVTIKGIIKSKVDVDMRVIMLDTELKKIIGRGDNNVDEISVILKPDVDPMKLKDLLVAEGYNRFALIQTWEEAQPKFLNDIKATFGLLGNLIGSIGLAVAAITIFIIIFVNAITRRRFIGILKGIGIRSLAIEFSYVIQSLFYALCGIIIGSIVVFFFLKPFIAAHPINFP